MTFIVVCGGTAGHINPGLAIAEELRNRLPNAKILFIGADRDLEKRLVPQAGYELVNIKMSGVKRGLRPRDIMYNIKTVINVLTAERKASEIMKKENPSAVIGTGGYICYPVLKAAARRKIPTFIHESNALPGMTVKMLSSIVTKVMITYTGYEQYYKRPERLVLTGTPVRKGFVESGGAVDGGELVGGGAVGGELAGGAVGEDEVAGVRGQTRKPIVVSFWGSLGAERMNEIMAGFIKRNISEQRFYHIHATGSSAGGFYERLDELGVTENHPPYADIRRYIDNMPDVLKSADLVLCRAGATTLAELTALGKPSILIPSPYVPDKGQFENAKQLSELGAAVLLQESECNADMLFERVSFLVNNRDEMAKMAKAAKSIGKKGAASDIADLILGASEK